MPFTGNSPAFPQQFFAAGATCPEGMDIRTYLAAHAEAPYELVVKVLESNGLNAPTGKQVADLIAKIKVAIADATIEQLNKPITKEENT